ncbi:MAG TPA: tyrosine/phenylalanine carboxypeptidase domain-containing protein, partial [Polyangiaceae bacterium]|nr:tyrosine/phenylalanine carboxypeptidase domain-containing protein [Polyangiaceae bacterium]
MPRATDRSLKAIQRAAPVLDDIAKRTRLLDTLQWPKQVEEQFFAQGARKLPAVEYPVDRDGAQAAIRDLRALIKELDRQDSVQQWLARIADSYLDGNRLLLAAGTKEFHAISTEVYGGPRSLFDADTTNLDLAEHLKKRLSGEREEASDPPSGPGEPGRR